LDRLDLEKLRVSLVRRQHILNYEYDYMSHEFALCLELPQYLHEAGWTAGQRVVACTQVIHYFEA